MSPTFSLEVAGRVATARDSDEQSYETTERTRFTPLPMSPPRPSVSPLSNAQASTKASPLASRSNARSDGELNDRQHYDDDKSSSLSEPDEDEEDEEDAEGEEEEEDAPSTHRRHVRSRSQDIDSEAETERLESTPRKTRDGAVGLGRTPSKLAAVEHADDDLSDPPSPLPDGAGAASSTSTLTGKKRKRSDTLESPLTSADSTDGESKRKRSEGMKVEDLDDSREDTVEGGPQTQPTKSVRGKKGKVKRPTRANEAVESVETPDPPEELEQEDTTEAQPDEDPVRKSEAMDAFAQLGKQFMAFRDALIRERVSSIDAELALLEQPDCQHPEYLRMVACVEQRRQKQDREARAYHHYKQISVRQRTLGDRAQLHSQYFQTVRDVREQALDELGAEWYAIHRERRQGVNYRPEDGASRYQYIDSRSDQLRQQAKYNHEVSILSGFAKYVGFPAAPDIGPVAGDSLDEDLKAMKLIRRAPATNHTTHQHHTHHHHTHAYTPYMPRHAATVASQERIAHEQYIEQHAWARAPQYTTHHTPLASTPNISHTPEWAEHTTGFRKPVAKHVSSVPSTGLFATPNSTRALKDGVEIHDTDGPESAPQSHRLGLTDSSPLPMSKHRLNAGADKDAWRNYSGTSTIDAPLGDTAREDDGQANRHVAAEHGEPLPRISDSAAMGTQAPAASHGSTGLFFDERPDIFRSTGFRPLDSNFATAAATQGSVSGR